MASARVCAAFTWVNRKQANRTPVHGPILLTGPETITWLDLIRRSKWTRQSTSNVTQLFGFKIKSTFLWNKIICDSCSKNPCPNLEVNVRKGYQYLAAAIITALSVERKLNPEMVNFCTYLYLQWKQREPGWFVMKFTPSSKFDLSMTSQFSPWLKPVLLGDLLQGSGRSSDRYGFLFNNKIIKIPIWDL